MALGVVVREFKIGLNKIKSPRNNSQTIMWELMVLSGKPAMLYKLFSNQITPKC
jgi:hypothetical protein